MDRCFPCFTSSSADGEKKKEAAPSSLGASRRLARVGSEEANSKSNTKSHSKSKHSKSERAADKIKPKNTSPKKKNPIKKKNTSDKEKEVPPPRKDNTRIFTFQELVNATRNFRKEALLGEGGFGRVYKGRLEKDGTVVAVKQLDQKSLQGNREFLVEVLMLSLLHHPNLVNLIGYCAEGDQRLLVYEYMPLGALDDHLHDVPPNKKALDWNTRMRIAAGAAKGLEYLHDKASPPVIYRDFKSSNILLGEGYHPKLSDFGLAKLGPVGDRSHVTTRVMGTYGYCAPEYAMTGQLTLKSDVYSFGVVFLELITGRKAIDRTKVEEERNLAAWARPMFNDRKKFTIMADPLLQGNYPMRGLFQAIAIAAMCLHEQAVLRPPIGDVVTAISYLASQNYNPSTTSRTSSSASRSRRDRNSNVESNQNSPQSRQRECEGENKQQK